MLKKISCFGFQDTKLKIYLVICHSKEYYTDDKKYNYLVAIFQKNAVPNNLKMFPKR